MVSAVLKVPGVFSQLQLPYAIGIRSRFSQPSVLEVTFRALTLIACEAAAFALHVTGVSFTTCTRSGTNDATNELWLPSVLDTSQRRQPCIGISIEYSLSRVEAPEMAVNGPHMITAVLEHLRPEDVELLLANRGLPSVGGKEELAERLQSALCNEICEWEWETGDVPEFHCGKLCL